MASLNRNIKTGNFIPGSEEYTHPEEIAIMGKYLKAGIKELSDNLSLVSDADKGISSNAEIKSIKNLPGEETLTGIGNENEKINQLNSSLEELKTLQNKLELDNEFEKLVRQKEEDLNLEVNLERLQNLEKQEKLETDYTKLSVENKNLSLGNEKEFIHHSDSGDEINPVDIRLYEKIYSSDPRKDKRALPDSENIDPKFRTLDTLLGGIHYDKYSSETLSRSSTPTKDAVNAASDGSSDIIFVKPETLNTKETSLVNDSVDQLANDNEEVKDLPNYIEDLLGKKKIKLNKEFEELEKFGQELKELPKDREDFLGKPQEIELEKDKENLEKSKEEIKLSSIAEILKNENGEISLSSIKEKLADDTFKVTLSDFLDNLSLDEREVFLSKFVSDLLDGRITELEQQKDYLPGELKKAILIDHLKETISNEKDLQLILESEELYGKELDIALSNFISKLNKNLKSIIELNSKYITLGKNESAGNYLDDLYTELSQIASSEFSIYIPGELKELMLNLGIEKIPEPYGDSSEFYKLMKDNYGIDNAMTAEDLKKTLNELIRSNGGWGKKVAAYLSALIGKYKNFKMYLPKEEIINFKNIVTSTLKANSYVKYLTDPDYVTKETLIKETFALLRKLTTHRIKNVEKIINNNDLANHMGNGMYALSVGEQKYSKDASLSSAWKNIKSELIDKTWDNIKSWVTSTLNGSLWGAAGSLLTTKANLPGQNYTTDTTVRNVPNVSSLYEKKTHTTGFAGTPYATPMEITQEDESLGWVSRALSNSREYNFKKNYLMSTGIQQTLKDLCDTDISTISSVEDLYDVLKSSEKTTVHARTQEGVMNGMTLSSNHTWEITIEPYISKFNGYRTWLPFFQEINRYNYRTHGVRTIYDKWLPITSFELQDKRLVNKTLALYAGEISYPIAMENSNELRLTFSDDSFKSFRTYFDRVAEISTYESLINKEEDETSARLDANFAKRRKFDSFVFSKSISENVAVGSTYDTIDRDKFAVGMYKNLCFNVCIYILTPQYSTIKKYNLLCVMKDYSIEYVGEIDSGPADVTVSFSIVGETTPELERDAERELEFLRNQFELQNLLNLEKTFETALDNMHNSILNKKEPLSLIKEEDGLYIKTGALNQEENRTTFMYTKNGDLQESYSYGEDDENPYSTKITNFGN